MLSLLYPCDYKETAYSFENDGSLGVPSSHLIEEKTEFQSGAVGYPRSHSQAVQCQGWDPCLLSSVLLPVQPSQSSLGSEISIQSLLEFL